MAMSASSSALASGRTTRTFLMRRSYFLPASAKALLQVREQPAIAHHVNEGRRDRLALERLVAVFDVNPACLRIDPDSVPVMNSPCLRAHHRGQAEVQRIAVEEAGEGFGHQRRHAKVLERRRRLLAR